MWYNTKNTAVRPYSQSASQDQFVNFSRSYFDFVIFDAMKKISDIRGGSSSNITV